jgi:hypothetical protein
MQIAHCTGEGYVKEKWNIQRKGKDCLMLGGGRLYKIFRRSVSFVFFFKYLAPMDRLYRFKLNVRQEFKALQEGIKRWKESEIFHLMP